MLQFRRGPWTTAGAPALARLVVGRTAEANDASLSYDSIWQRSASPAASHQPRGIISDEVVLDAKVRREERQREVKGGRDADEEAGGEDGWTDKVRLYKQARVGTSTGCLKGRPIAIVDGGYFDRSAVLSTLWVCGIRYGWTPTRREYQVLPPCLHFSAGFVCAAHLSVY